MTHTRTHSLSLSHIHTDTLTHAFISHTLTLSLMRQHPQNTHRIFPFLSISITDDFCISPLSRANIVQPIKRSHFLSLFSSHAFAQAFAHTRARTHTHTHTLTHSQQASTLTVKLGERSRHALERNNKNFFLPFSHFSSSTICLILKFNAEPIFI